MNSPLFRTDLASPIIPSAEYTRLPDIGFYRQDLEATGMSAVHGDSTWIGLMGELAHGFPSTQRRELGLAVIATYLARMSEDNEAIFPLGVFERTRRTHAVSPCSVVLTPEDRFDDILGRVQRATCETNVGLGECVRTLHGDNLAFLVTTGSMMDSDAVADVHLHCYDDGAIDLRHANNIRHDAIALIVERITALLQGIVSDPSLPLIHQPIMSERERNLVVQDRNATDETYGYDGGLVAMMERAASETPDHPALMLKDVTLSHAEFNNRVNRLARVLRKKGVEKDQFVCLCMDRSLEMVIAIWATLKAGGAYVPLNVEDPAARVNEIVADCQPKVLLTQHHIRDRLETTATEIVVLPEGGDIDPTGDASDLKIEIGPNDLAYMIYTSGSTGKPKGVVVEHAAIHNRVVWMHEEYGLAAEDRVLQKTPYTFDVSVWEFLWPVSVGSTLVIAEPGGHTAIGYLYGLIRDAGVTHLHFVPSVFRLFLMAPALDQLPIKKLFCSGEALGADLVRSFYDKANDYAEVHNLYGPTEAAVDVSYFACPRNSKGNSIPIGRPVANTSLYVLDAFDQPVPVGVPGELHIGGIQLARGYWARDELTAERFVPSPSADFPHDRLYRTGDLAVLRPDGQIVYLGRNDFQVKVNGVRIELGEIEAAILEQRGVTDVVVVPEESAGNKRLIAYVVAGAPSIAEAKRLQDGVASSRPASYVPKEVRFIAKMPLSTSGKVNRKVLAAQTMLGIGDQSLG